MNYFQLTVHLLATIDDFTDEMCVGNPKVSKEWFWNNCIAICAEKEDEEVVNELLVKNVLREFPVLNNLP